MAGTQQAAIAEAELGGIQGSHLANGVLQSEQLALANVDAEDAREGAETARMRIAAPAGADDHSRLVLVELGPGRS